MYAHPLTRSPAHPLTRTLIDASSPIRLLTTATTTVTTTATTTPHHLRLRSLDDLLDDQLRETCLEHPAGWWTYRWCHGKDVRQFHKEKNKTVSPTDITSLGARAVAPAGAGAGAGEGGGAELKKSLGYHAQVFEGGKGCDETGKGRNTEVRFYCCDPNQKSLVSFQSIDEPKVCSYTLSLCSPLVCHRFPAKVPRAHALLAPLENVCTQRHEGWWSYEFCFKKHVRQFHVHTFKEAKTGKSQSIVQGEYVLGRWDQGTAGAVTGGEGGTAGVETGGNTGVIKRRTLPNADPSQSAMVYAQQYPQGSRCDLTAGNRSSEVTHQNKREGEGEGDIFSTCLSACVRVCFE